MQVCTPYHPLGTLVRNATLEEVYAWLHERRPLMHRFLGAAYDQVAATIEAMACQAGSRLTGVGND